MATIKTGKRKGENFKVAGFDPITLMVKADDGEYISLTALTYTAEEREKVRAWMIKCMDQFLILTNA